jgi:LysM repeat protein
MSQSLVFGLLILALVVPVIGALGLRLLAPRASPTHFYGAAALLFGVAFASALVLARSNLTSLQVGELSLLLPVAAPAEEDLNLPPLTIAPAPEEPATAVPAATRAPAGSPTETLAPAPTSIPTAVPTAAPPTAVLPTAAPPTAAPTEAPSAPAQRTYVVQPGDTLRGIAEQFGVSVQALIEANNLTPEEADALRIGQELVIPPANP